MKNVRCLFVTFLKETTQFTKPMRLGVAALVFAVGLGVGAARVEAQIYWISNGGGCVPEDSAIANDFYWTVTGGMRVKFRPNRPRPSEGQFFGQVSDEHFASQCDETK